MTQTARALYAFFGSFGLPAWPEDNVPDAQGESACETCEAAADFPRITYTPCEPAFGESTALEVRLWFWAEGYEEACAALDRLCARVPDGAGTRLRTPDGLLWLLRGDPFIRMEPTGERALKCACVRLTLRAYTG